MLKSLNLLTEPLEDFNQGNDPDSTIEDRLDTDETGHSHDYRQI